MTSCLLWVNSTLAHWKSGNMQVNRKMITSAIHKKDGILLQLLVVQGKHIDISLGKYAQGEEVKFLIQPSTIINK